jgi:putative ubiquitin-RnfH superfamily antitoxin RatB of RatAB toxin-antitoxin module
LIRVSFAGAWASWQGVIQLELPDGATVASALAEARALLRESAPTALDEPEWADGVTGIFGEACGRDRRLRDGDRVELYRPLSVDPKAARRARAQAASRAPQRAPPRGPQG